MSGLTAKQEEFCQQYLVDFNATAAAIRAGYSDKTANQQGPKLLVNVGIQHRLDELSKAAAERNDLTVDGVLESLKQLRDKAISLNQMGPAVRAEELRGKYLAMFVDRKRVENVSAMSNEQYAASLADGNPGVQALFMDMFEGGDMRDWKVERRSGSVN